MILNALLLLTNLLGLELHGRLPNLSHVASNIAAPVHKQEANNYTVLPLSQIRLVSHDFEGYAAGQLTSADFIVIEGKLDEFAKQYNHEAEKRSQEWAKRVPVLKWHKTSSSINLSTYRRQYICGINKTGEKVVWVNCFCCDYKEALQYWTKQVVYVMDGGDCYFNLKINLTKKIKYDIMVNGLA